MAQRLSRPLEFTSPGGADLKVRGCSAIEEMGRLLGRMIDDYAGSPGIDPHGHHAHARDCVECTLAATGFVSIGVVRDVPRTQGGVPMCGLPRGS